MSECEILLGCIYDKEKRVISFIPLEEHDKQIRAEVNKETSLKIIHTRRVLHDIQRMDMPKDVYERLNYELDKILYDWSEQLKGE